MCKKSIIFAFENGDVRSLYCPSTAFITNLPVRTSKGFTKIERNILDATSVFTVVTT